ncbi:MAG: hypothetical protein DRP01_11125 [Archaeoglobales archaeon]|nr:MAG: hypothetical protein DRP01_11125 [Archaeoglobales archaeon]
MGRKRKVMRFKSKEAYLRWLRYGHATKVFEKTPGHVTVYIRGKRHRVKHVRPKRKRRKRRVRKR